MSDSLRRNVIIIVIAAVAALILGIFVATWLFGPDSSEATPTPLPATATTAPTFTPTPAPTATEELTDQVWERIQAAGKLVVGTSADYPPFSFYDNSFQIAGFDPALIRQIGQQLGLEVELRDFTFDGLAAALQVGQIDLAIAAISFTPERDAVVDFSNIYFVTEDAILARGDADIAIQTVTDLAPYRVGVQDLSVYESWLEEELIDTGLMPPSNLFVYRIIDTAVADLVQGEDKLDLVVMDLPPAEVAVAAADVAIVGQGLNRQRLAIALPQGAVALQARVNEALAQLQADNQISILAQTYMGIGPEDIITVPTPDPSVPTATPVPPPDGCIDAMSLVADITYDDVNMTAPPALTSGQPFEKIWRVLNTGTCTWDSSYQLIYVGGNVPAAQMGGTAVAVPGTVGPGQEVDLAVNLVAPLTPGLYLGFWELSNSRGQLFGERLLVGIQVPEVPQPTPLPTQTPSPGISFGASSTSILQGECTTLNWAVEGAQAVYLHILGEPWNQNGVPGQGARTVCPAATTTYELRVVWPDGRVEVRQITVVVQPVSGLPIITRFTTNPSYQIFVNQCLSVEWVVDGQVNQVRVTRNDAVLWASAPLSGRVNDCPPGLGQVVYAIEATGPGGTSRAQLVVTILDPNPPQPVATPTPPPDANAPYINYLVVSPNQVQVGQCVTVGWSVAGGTTRVQLKVNGIVVFDNAPFQLTGPDCIDQVGSSVYRIEAYSNAGQMVSREVSVLVSEGPPNNVLAGTSWRLLSYASQTSSDTIPVLNDTTLTAVFDFAGSLNGFGGCNSYSASYAANDNLLSIANLLSTQIICSTPAGVTEQESSFFTLLTAAANFQLADGQLLVQNAAGRTILTFTAN